MVVHLTRLMEVYFLAHVCLACTQCGVELDELLRIGDFQSYVSSVSVDDAEISTVQGRVKFESENAQLIQLVINTKSVVECDY